MGARFTTRRVVQASLLLVGAMVLSSCTAVHAATTSSSSSTAPSSSLPPPSTSSSSTSSPTSPPHPGLLPMGTVTGVLRWSSSAASAGKPLTRGTVTFTGSVVRSVKVDGGGRFSLSLPIGSYQVTGTSPELTGSTGGCSVSGAVVVAAGASQTLQVVCQTSS